MHFLSSSSEQPLPRPIAVNPPVLLTSESPNSEPDRSHLSTVSPATVASDRKDVPQSPMQDEDDEDDEDLSFPDWTAALVSLCFPLFTVEQHPCHI
jgi:hypothetical protein